MESHKAADLLTSYVDKQNAFIVSRIGTQAVAAAFEMQATDITVAMKLNEDEFARYMSTLDVQQPAKHRADPTEQFLDAWQEFTYSVTETFGELDGYGLAGVDEYGLSLVRMERAEDQGSSLVRLSAQVVGTDININKVQQYIDSGNNVAPLPMRVRPLERLTINMAFERLRGIVETA